MSGMYDMEGQESMREDIVYRDRRNTDCEKWDDLIAEFGRDDILPAWVADMDLESPACVKKALDQYVNENVFGYYKVSGEYYEQFVQWEKKYHNYTVSKEWIRFAPGVVQAIYWIIRSVTVKGDSIAIMDPVYYPFKNAIIETDRSVVNIPLINEEGRYVIDYELMEKSFEQHDVKLLLFCSPHNPVGRVWTEEELLKVLNICKKYNVRIISDEIHQDLILANRKNVALGSLDPSGNTVMTLTSPSKTFNLAGCQNSFVILPGSTEREKFDRFTRRIHISDGNNFGYIACTAAYRDGRPWLESLLDKIRANYRLFCDGLSDSLPNAVVSPLEGTYLAWVDLSAYFHGMDFSQILVERCKLGIDYGSLFGGPQYNDFIRVNLATSSENVDEIVRRLGKIKSIS